MNRKPAGLDLSERPALNDLGDVGLLGHPESVAARLFHQNRSIADVRGLSPFTNMASVRQLTDAKARALLPEDLWPLLEAHLPIHLRSSKGGPPRIDHRAAMTGTLFVLKTGIPWDYLPRELGCGSGMTCWLAFTNGCEPAFGSASTRRFFDGSESMTRSCGIGLALTLRAFRHVPEASTRAEIQPIAANSEANTICWWMSAGFH